jgi:hypothetical protein
VSGAAKSLVLVRQRARRLPAAIAADLAAELASDSAAALHALPRSARGRRWVATGAGGSEGPARAFVAALQARGVPARFRPLSSFFATADDGAARVVFSQGLSPNARLALRDCPLLVVVTAVSSDEPGPAGDALRAACARGALVISHGPPAEGELLVRIEGPTRATLAGLRLAEQIAGDEPRSGRLGPAPADLPAAMSAAGQAQTALSGPLALVTAGDGWAFAHGLRWKLLEGLGVADPPIWDVLQVAHGPLQQFYEHRLTLLGLECGGHSPLFDRLERVLVPQRHRLFRLRARLAHPWSFFEHDAQVNELIIATLGDAPRDLIHWPGKGRDGSLYELSS